MSTLEHHGVKGMHWGVRKDGQAGTYGAPNASSGLVVDQRVHPDLQAAGTKVASLMADRYHRSLSRPGAKPFIENWVSTVRLFERLNDGKI